MDDTIKLTLELALEVRALHRRQPDDKRNRSRTGEECECEELRLRRGSPLQFVITAVVPLINQYSDNQIRR